MFNRGAKCLGCGYSLFMLGELRCPECGRAFDPADPKSYGPRDSVGRRRRVLLAYGVVLLMVMFLGAGIARHPFLGAPTIERTVIGALFSIAGPMFFLLARPQPQSAIGVAFGVTLLWLVWLLCATRTPLVRVPAWCHALAASLWCMCSLLLMGLSI